MPNQSNTQPTSANVRTSVIIPALNEAASIANVLRDIPDYVTQIIVTDNGSTDETVAIAEENGAMVVHEARRGYGAACLCGMAALDDPDIVVFLDGDYSDHPEQMDALIQPILDDEVDMIIGSRALGNAEPGALTPQARYGNKLACFLMRLFWGVRYTDLGPFRAIRYSSLQQLNMTDTNYGWTVEMQIKAALHKLRTCEVPVDYRKRIGKSKVSGTVRGVIGASYKILYTIFISAARYHLVDKRRRHTDQKNPIHEADFGPSQRMPSQTQPDTQAQSIPYGSTLSIPYGSTDRQVIIFTRYPEPGKTKTRLIPELGPEAAADLQRKMTEHALRTAETLSDIQIEIHYTDADKETMIQWLGEKHKYVLQHPGNLGDRMFQALRSAFEGGIDHAILIGVDCPAITPTILETAFTSLHEKDITIGPATDGGYYLIGARSTTPAVALGHLFTEIEWGTETVYPQTIQRLQEEKIPWHRLAYLNDIDTPEDLPEWHRVQLQPSTHAPPHPDSETVAQLSPTRADAAVPELPAAPLAASPPVIPGSTGDLSRQAPPAEPNAQSASDPATDTDAHRDAQSSTPPAVSRTDAEPETPTSAESRAPKPPLTIIIPTLNEARNIEETLQSAQVYPEVEIIVVDGGSTDDTIEKATNMGVKVITAPKGRASQMNRGAAHAASDTLLFLHADTILPRSYLKNTQETLKRPSAEGQNTVKKPPETICGAFKFKTDHASISMKIITIATNFRSRYRQLPYGDQAMFMGKNAFHRVSGYPDVPIMEDYILIKKLKKLGPIKITQTPAITNARRWQKNGPLKTTFFNQLIIILYHLGRDPTKIAVRYRGNRK